ncbi:MAG: type I toxin-antitoxin system Fst family toxin [Furfurilactobacillus sp.]|uniref:Type I toxin-antitoxin system Fst family toxin n=1 Tax=Furfurilactobacillus milii TaxID=2888272 RepID=A0A6N9I2J5_9LACO|nr:MULTISPECIES: type I toxin-antitoxin system Fst family toxin [Furfurilactobacillus]MCF6161043.1 type I toxin-antitoxin system Fst family toxin [Furfurilactobacillus milii]MCF6163467.1 type I toxin-antitoxin system Fst family toxin [Furfurilactobacillus milii]MCF6164617.1 type I toxin-antitoxin system Fst family toxin [Furfurilactobacillus rossiae]MCF6418732.1 type I toxin-antitoxin system Fst family toxin [Furfurilactobacillus milii]MCH4011457.1 type I toxin-antitoxin system Fst family toxi
MLQLFLAPLIVGMLLKMFDHWLDDRHNRP